MGLGVSSSGCGCADSGRDAGRNNSLGKKRSNASETEYSDHIVC